MKRYLRILANIKPYKGRVVSFVIFSLFSVVFSLGSFALAINFLGLLFDNHQMVSTAPPLDFTSVDSLRENFNLFISNIIREKGQTSALVMICLFVVVTVFFKTGFLYMSRFVITPLRNGIIRDYRDRIYTKIIDLPISYYSEEKKGDIMSRISNDVNEIDFSIIRSLDIIFNEPITIAVYLLALIYMSPELSLFVLVLLPLTGLIIGRIGKTLRKKSTLAQNKMGFILSIVEETLGGLRIIKAFNAEKKMNLKFANENLSYMNLMNRILWRRDLASPVSEFLGTIVVVVIMWFGGRLVLENKSDLTPQDFIGYLIIFSQILNPAKSFSQAYYNIQKGMASAERIDEILDAENKIVEKENALNISKFERSIEFKNVSFKYIDEYVLKAINLKIEKGKTIALVGQSGSGKSTLVDLIPRFYDVVEGEILIDGIPVKDLKISDLRSLMGNVNQESILFNDTIYNNISFGVDNATENDVIRAAKVANAHEFIMETPLQYQTNIGDRGSKLSGGQRQRLSIARAVLKNPPIMILDEATSALDTESERLVQDALTNLMKNRTSIVIAHRLSTVVNADEICCLHEGQIVERGTHDELLKLNGKYKKLYDLQAFA